MILLTSLGGASSSLICLIISLILLFIAAFITGSAASPAPAPWYNRVAFGWAGMFFYVLSVALG